MTEEELVRARENVKARIVLGLESAGARMSRLGASVLYGLPLLEIDEIMARIDAVSLADLSALVEELWAPEALSAAGIGPDEAAFTDAVAAGLPGRGAPRGVTRVAVAGAAGRMGQAVCAAVEGADDLVAERAGRPGAGRRAGGRARRRRRRRRLHGAGPGARRTRARAWRRASTW